MWGGICGAILCWRLVPVSLNIYPLANRNGFFFLLSKPMSSLVTDRRKHSPTSPPSPENGPSLCTMSIQFAVCHNRLTIFILNRYEWGYRIDSFNREGREPSSLIWKIWSPLPLFFLWSLYHIWQVNSKKKKKEKVDAPLSFIRLLDLLFWSYAYN